MILYSMYSPKEYLSVLVIHLGLALQMTGLASKSLDCTKYVCV